MEGPTVSEQDHQVGLVTKALDTVANAYKIGGYLLSAMVIGTALMILAALFGRDRSIMMFTGAILLCLCMALVIYLYVKPFRDLKQKLDERSEFLKVSQDGVVRMAATVKSFSGGIAENHENVALALRAVRPYLDSVPAVASWIDGAQDLSADLIKHSLALRDASNSIEVAFSMGDAQRLRQSLEEAQKLAEQIKATAAPTRIIERLDLAGDKFEELAKSDMLRHLNVGLQLAMPLVLEIDARPKKGGALSDMSLADVVKTLGDAGVGDMLLGFLRRSGREGNSA